MQKFSYNSPTSNPIKAWYIFYAIKIQFMDYTFIRYLNIANLPAYDIKFYYSSDFIAFGHMKPECNTVFCFVYYWC
jgi:hypothetical protein